MVVVASNVAVVAAAVAVEVAVVNVWGFVVAEPAKTFRASE